MEVGSKDVEGNGHDSARQPKVADDISGTAVVEQAPLVPEPAGPGESTMDGELPPHQTAEKSNDLDHIFSSDRKSHAIRETDESLQALDAKTIFPEELEHTDVFSGNKDRGFVEDKSAHVDETVDEGNMFELGDELMPESDDIVESDYEVRANELSNSRFTIEDDPELGYTGEADDPESRGYTLLKGEDDQIEAQVVDPELGNNTSADVQDAEEGCTKDNSVVSSSTRSEHVELADDQVAAFSQVQGTGSLGATALEFVALQLVDPSIPVPQMQSKRLEDNEDQIGHPPSSNWWDPAGNDDEFAFSRVENEGGFNDDFNPVKSMNFRDITNMQISQSNSDSQKMTLSRR
jgi:hypothetical protein